MQLPKYRKDKNRRKKKIKTCKECGKEYWGHPISKYCEVHRIASLRKRKKREYENPNIKNQTFKHLFHETTDVEFPCQVPGCGKFITLPMRLL